MNTDNLKEQMDDILSSVRNSSKSLIQVFKTQEEQMGNYKDVVHAFCRDLEDKLLHNVSLKLELLEVILNEMDFQKNEELILTLMDYELLSEAYEKRKYDLIRNTYNIIEKSCSAETLESIHGHLEKLFKNKPLNAKYVYGINQHFVIFVAVNFGLKCLTEKSRELLITGGLDTVLSDKDDCPYKSDVTVAKPNINNIGINTSIYDLEKLIELYSSDKDNMNIITNAILDIIYVNCDITKNYTNAIMLYSTLLRSQEYNSEAVLTRIKSTLSKCVHYGHIFDNVFFETCIGMRRRDFILFITNDDYINLTNIERLYAIYIRHYECKDDSILQRLRYIPKSIQIFKAVKYTRLQYYSSDEMKKLYIENAKLNIFQRIMFWFA